MNPLCDTAVGLPSTPPEWQLDLIERLRARARDLRSEASRLDALATKIESPPEGVSVEYGGWDSVHFVGPMAEVVT